MAKLFLVAFALLAVAAAAVVAQQEAGQQQQQQQQQVESLALTPEGVQATELLQQAESGYYGGYGVYGHGYPHHQRSYGHGHGHYPVYRYRHGVDPTLGLLGLLGLGLLVG